MNRHTVVVFIGGLFDGVFMLRIFTAFILLSFSLPSFAGFINHEFKMQKESGEQWALVVQVNEFWKLPNRYFSRDEENLAGSPNNRYDLADAFGPAMGEVFGIYGMNRVDYNIDFWGFGHDTNGNLQSLTFELPNSGNIFEGSFYWGAAGNDFRGLTNNGLGFASETVGKGFANYKDGAYTVVSNDASVPEPATAALSLLALAGLGATRFFKRKA